MTFPKIWLSSPHMGNEELPFVKEAFDTNWIAPLGPNVDGFETDLQVFNQVKSVAALSSGTAALHLALILLNVQTGDEVLCQSFTFSATANPIIYQNAIPVFVDSDINTWNMCPNTLEKAIKNRIKRHKKPKAIVAVHLYGMPANMPEIMRISDKYEIPVIEDSAEALGSSINGQKCGTFGKIGILSFNGNKIITTSGGGALLSNDESLVRRARFLATQSRDPAPHYEHSAIGYNYRMSNVCAGIGRGQMKVLDERITQRRKNYLLYKQELSQIACIEFLEEPSNYFSNRWLTTIIINENKKNITPEIIRISLEELNIESRPLWKPMHLQPIFKDYPYYGEGFSEKLFKKGLCLPSGSNLSETDLYKVINRIKSLF